MTTIRGVIMLIGTIKKAVKDNKLTRMELDALYSKLEDALQLVVNKQEGGG
jgi:hypothetical protein